MLLVVLFCFELQGYLTVTTQTDLVVDEMVDEVLRVNFNVSLHQVLNVFPTAVPPLPCGRHSRKTHRQVPCEYLSVDVSDLTGMNSHNISKDILKWRLDQHQVKDP